MRAELFAAVGDAPPIPTVLLWRVSMSGRGRVARVVPSDLIHFGGSDCDVRDASGRVGDAGGRLGFVGCRLVRGFRRCTP